MLVCIYIDGEKIEDYISQGWEVTFIKYYHSLKIDGMCFLASRNELVDSQILSTKKFIELI